MIGGRPIEPGAGRAKIAEERPSDVRGLAVARCDWLSIDAGARLIEYRPALIDVFPQSTARSPPSPRRGLINLSSVPVFLRPLPPVPHLALQTHNQLAAMAQHATIALKRTGAKVRRARRALDV